MPPSPNFDPQIVLDALARRPDGVAVLALAAPGTAVVGGFVRDCLLGVTPREVDVVVEADADAFARAIGGRITTHAAFGTARVERDGWVVDIATARSESYPRPGALPVVEPATLEHDLVRRDFTINAIAVTLDKGRLLAADRALEDLAAARLRVLHDRSFIDDPTRVMRLARYAHRLEFIVEPHTRALADSADLSTVTPARIAAELRLALSELDPLAPLADLVGKLPIAVDRDLIEAALEIAPDEADHGLVILAAVMREVAPPGWIAQLELTTYERDVVLDAWGARAIADRIEVARSPSALYVELSHVQPEVIAIAGALGAASQARFWLDELRHVKLDIGGDDLLAAGLAPGAEIGIRLQRTLWRKLDGELRGGRDAELAYALEDVV